MSIFTKVYPIIEHVPAKWVPDFKYESPAYDRRDYSAPYTVEETFAGAVLCDREHNYHDDSDGYSHVWNAEKQRIDYIGTWTTRFGDFHAGTKVDAFDGPFIDDIRAWLIDWYVKARIDMRKQEFDKAAYDLAQVGKGDTVTVVKGRKVPIGVTGTVIWVGESSFGYTVTTRIGVKDAAGTVHWTAASNVRKDNIEQPDIEDFGLEDEFRSDANLRTTQELARMHCGYGAAMAGLVRI
jgi:hypothetical protein